MESAFDLRPNPPPSRVTFTLYLVLRQAEALARLVRAACGECTQPHASQRSEPARTTAAGRSMVACANPADSTPPPPFASPSSSPHRHRRYCAPPYRAAAAASSCALYASEE